MVSIYILAYNCFLICRKQYLDNLTFLQPIATIPPSTTLNKEYLDELLHFVEYDINEGEKTDLDNLEYGYTFHDCTAHLEKLQKFLNAPDYQNIVFNHEGVPVGFSYQSTIIIYTNQLNSICRLYVVNPELELMLYQNSP